MNDWLLIYHFEKYRIRIVESDRVGSSLNLFFSVVWSMRSLEVCVAAAASLAALMKKAKRKP